MLHRHYGEAVSAEPEPSVDLPIAHDDIGTSVNEPYRGLRYPIQSVVRGPVLSTNRLLLTRGLDGMPLRQILKNSFVGPLVRQLYFKVAARRFLGSRDYWLRRYRAGGSSGPGSVGRLARFKADVLNAFVRENAVSSVVEFGCGDGSQLELCEYPNYLGLDVSPAAVELCRRRFRGDATKSFAVLGAMEPGSHDVALSLDVIFHLVEDGAFEAHMVDLFASGQRFVVIYSSNGTDAPPAPHVRHRFFTEWVERHRPDWALTGVTRNKYPYDPRNEDATSFADFYFFKRITA